MPTNRTKIPATKQDRLVAALLKDRKALLDSLDTIEQESTDASSRETAKGAREKVSGGSREAPVRPTRPDLPLIR